MGKHACVPILLAFMLGFCMAQEGMFGGLYPFSQTSEQGSSSNFFPFGPFGFFPFTGLGSSGEQGVSGGFGPYGLLSLAMLGPEGGSGQAGEQSGAEAPAETPEGSTTQQQALFDLGRLMLLNQLISHSALMPRYDSTSFSLESGLAPPKAETPSQTGRGGSEGQSLGTEMSLLPFLFLPQ